ncbi:MAG TPA: CoA transferase [Acidimicrobiia bacterium]
MGPTPFLSGLSVLEFGDGVAGAVAAGTLALLGADVTKAIEDPPRLARHQPMLDHVGVPPWPLLPSVLDRSKRLVAADDPRVHNLSITADIVIDDRVDGIDDAETYLRRVGERNLSVWLTISPFGLSGPRTARRGGELIAQAAGGLLSTIEPVGGGRPTSPPGFVALRAVGHVAALAALHGIDRFRGDGCPTHVDVSAQEAVVFTGALPECAHLLFRCPGRAGSGRYVAPSGLFPCRDGLVRIAAIEDHQWKGMVACLGTPTWTEGLETRPARAEHAAMITERVGEWSAQQRKAECADLLQRNGVPSTPVNGPDELLTSTQFQSRGFLVQTDVDGVRATVPGAPWVVTTVDPARRVGPASQTPVPPRLAGLRVTELTHVLAGPIVGSLLGAMGADVVRLEDERRLDIYRRTGPFAEGVAGVERGAYFAAANFSKRSVVAGAEEMDAAVALLLDRTDVVIENIGRSRLERLGVLPEKVTHEHDALFLHVSGFGTDGPLAEYRVYANNVQAYGGLAHLTRDAQGEPAHLATVLADPLSSVVAATAVAAWALGPQRGTGVDVDLSMAEVVASLLGEFVAEASASRSVTVPLGNTLAPFSPHGVFASRDERWFAVAVQADDEWRRLVDALDHPPELTESRWNREPERWRERDVIERCLADVIARWDADALDEVLAAAEVRAAAVHRAVDLLADDHLRDRGFFPAFAHPDPDLHDARLVGMPWRLVGEGPLAQGAPPHLGDANADFDVNGMRR